MINLILRSIIIYSVLLVSVRVMGKRQIGDMQPFELVATLVIADLATIPMSDVSIPIFFGVIPLLTLVILHQILIIFNKKSIKFRKIFNGKPIIVINENGIDYEALSTLNMTINDLTEGLRMAGCFDISTVAYAIIETNGNISVLLKSAFSPPTANDMDIKTEESKLQVILISEGKEIEENIEYVGISNKDIESALKKEGVEKQDVLLLATDIGGNAYIQFKKGSPKTMQLKVKG